MSKTPISSGNPQSTVGGPGEGDEDEEGGKNNVVTVPGERHLLESRWHEDGGPGTPTLLPSPLQGSKAGATCEEQELSGK